jgi:ubiquinone/menaquinone biosynthesis C-methylase UbiE
MKKNTSWGKVAGWYDDLLEGGEDTYQKQVILPNILRLLVPKNGMAVLDLACGQGFFAREFSAAGATVVGADVSVELVALAAERMPEIRFLVAPADNLNGVADSSFDAVTIILAIQNIENLGETFAECSRILKTGGRLLLVLNHPAFRIPKKTAWGFDEKNSVQYRRVDEYISESRTEIEMHPGGEMKNATISFHRPLQTYFKSLQKSGFAVTRLEEWVSNKTSEDGPRAGTENRARKEIPLFLFLEAVKT